VSSKKEKKQNAIKTTIMKTQTLHIASSISIAHSAKATVAIKIGLFAGILACINLVAFM